MPSPEVARQRVREQKASGYDLLKTHGGLGQEAYDAMVDEARAQGLRVSGHVTPDVGLAHALEVGQQVEHLDGYLAALLPPGDPAAATFEQVDFSDALSRMDTARIAPLARATREAGVWSSPTLALFEIISTHDALPTLRAMPELRYASPASVAKWEEVLSSAELAQAPAEGKRRFVELRGQRADLLLLEANPLEDVRHTRAIAGVMTRGRWLPRAELDAKLEAVAGAVRAPPPVKPAP